MAQRKELKELTLKEKVDLLHFLESSSQTKTAEHFGVSKTTVSNIQKHKHEYLKRYGKERGDLQWKRRKTFLDEVNKATLSWFKQLRTVNARISRPMIQEVAKKFTQEFGVADFQASSGWLKKFKLCHKISQKVLCGESNEVPLEVVEEFINKFPDLARGFKDDEIFDADECGLFFKAMPDRSLITKGDKCKRGKLSKERFTVLLCASSTREKLKALVNGKSAKPRALKNLKPEDLPVTWRSNKCAWMTGALFKEWIRGIEEMKKKKLSILLTVDNCPGHQQVNHLTNVTLKFLPPNTTSKTQPLDQGIVKTFKIHYQAQLLQCVITKT
ncbi:tigger transposable element-derived protein 6-like [Protopterus annectens]|uniref:tigger transposable element-derived protein 6-like n=1 Tax=Protopterus annectens TaxID=7888 RepID=UPI001CFC083E|nr:tigger transposable element-derived protein 6-like [Protopterus annectens]